MKKILFLAVLALVAFCLPVAAQAGHVNFGVSIGVPSAHVYYGPSYYGPGRVYAPYYRNYYYGRPYDRYYGPYPYYYGPYARPYYSYPQPGYRYYYAPRYYRDRDWDDHGHRYYHR